MSKIKKWFKTWIEAREREALTRVVPYYHNRFNHVVDRVDLDVKLRKAGYGGI